MSWKEELVGKINALKPEDFTDGKAEVVVSYCLPWGDQFFCNAYDCVNSHSVGWVGPGYLWLKEGGAVRTPENMADGKLIFELSRDRKFNEVIAVDVFTGQAGKLELPLYDSVDFMSL